MEAVRCCCAETVANTAKVQNITLKYENRFINLD